jgi:hypothetical protein
MADDRLRNIREGAGKEDSRYSELMTDLLQKAGPWVMGAIIVGSAGYLGYTYFQNQRNAALSAAFFELEQAIDSGSPSSLEAVARTHAGQRSVTRLAELELGELYLASARRGTLPGTTLKPEGEVERPEDLLKPEQVTEFLAKAETAFRSSFEATKAEPVQALLTVRALMGLAAVAETKGDIEGAGRSYTDAAERAKAAGFEPLSVLANKRKETLGTLAGVKPLLPVTELPPKVQVASPFPTAPGVPGATGTTTGTTTMNVKPAGTTPPSDGAVGPPVPSGPANPPANPAPATPGPGAATPAPASPAPAPANPAPAAPAPGSGQPPKR